MEAKTGEMKQWGITGKKALFTKHSVMYCYSLILPSYIVPISISDSFFLFQLKRVTQCFKSPSPLLLLCDLPQNKSCLKRLLPATVLITRVYAMHNLLDSSKDNNILTKMNKHRVLCSLC